MKIITSLTVPAISAIVLIACSGASGSSEAKDSKSSAGSSDSVYAGDASVSYTIGNTHVAIKSYLVKGNQHFIALFLNDVKNNEASGQATLNFTNSLTSEVFNFSINNKGTTHILHYKPSLLNMGKSESYMSPKFKNYYADSLTVTISEINAKHIAGSFAGKFLTDDAKESVYINDGKFDLTYTKASDH